MNWLDLFDENAEADRKLHREHARVNASEACEDDCESSAGLMMSIMPDESHKHLIHTGRAIDAMIGLAMFEGCYE